MKYDIVIERSALKFLAKISGTDKEKIITAIEKLSINPRPIGAKKLTGRDGWRIKINNYRVIYEIIDKICKILILDIGHRKDIYRVF